MFSRPPPNKAMHLAALGAAGDRQAVGPIQGQILDTSSSGSRMRRLLIVPGHGVYWNGHWHGLPFEDPVLPRGHQGAVMYERHVEEGLRALQDDGRYDVVAFSGGRTRGTASPEVANVSEAAGMQQFAIDAGLLRQNLAPALVLEEWARDSFENVFFSILAYYRSTGEWPGFVGVISLAPKALRFVAIGCGLALGADQFQFHCSGGYGRRGARSPGGALAGEGADYVASMSTQRGGRWLLTDPLHRDVKKFGQKRVPDRTPSSYWRDGMGRPTSVKTVVDYGATEQQYLDALKSTYCRTPGDLAERLIEAVTSACPSDGWTSIDMWPWNPYPVLRR